MDIIIQIRYDTDIKYNKFEKSRIRRDRDKINEIYNIY